MQKRMVTMSDGKRRMTYYTFEESNSPIKENKADSGSAPWGEKKDSGK